MLRTDPAYGRSGYLSAHACGRSGSRSRAGHCHRAQGQGVSALYPEPPGPAHDRERRRLSAAQRRGAATTDAAPAMRIAPVLILIAVLALGACPARALGLPPPYRPRATVSGTIRIWGHGAYDRKRDF